MTLQRQTALEFLRRFPKAGTRTLVRMAMKEHSALWPTENACNCCFRAIRGGIGKEKRAKGLEVPEFNRGPQPNGIDPFGKLPVAICAFDEPWGAVQVDEPGRWGVLNDIHIPYHDQALSVALRHFKANGVQNVLLNGDTIDCYAVSNWETDPRKRDFAGELVKVRELLDIIRKAWPKARIIFKEGNHEERWERYMCRKAPELLGVEDFKLATLLRLDNFGIEHVGEKRPIRLGRLNVIHGHEYRQGFASPVNPARGLFLKAKGYALEGHFHQSSFHPENTIDGRSVACWSVGCLCQTAQPYAPLNNWQHGFAIVEVGKDGQFEVQNKTIKSGKVW